MSDSPADAAQWWNDQDWEHFLAHRHELGVRTVVEYDQSARHTIRSGRYFTYRDPDSGNLRVGYFAPTTGRFTAMNPSQTKIITHFVPDRGERYVLDLPESTYMR